MRHYTALGITFTGPGLRDIYEILECVNEDRLNFACQNECQAYQGILPLSRSRSLWNKLKLDVNKGGASILHRILQHKMTLTSVAGPATIISVVAFLSPLPSTKSSIGNLVVSTAGAVTCVARP